MVRPGPVVILSPYIAGIQCFVKFGFVLRLVDSGVYYSMGRFKQFGRNRLMVSFKPVLNAGLASLSPSGDSLH